MFSVKRAAEEIMYESQELMMEARREAMKIPSSPGMMPGRNVRAIFP